MDGGALAAGPAFASASPAPPAGDCPECVGVLNDLLNSCPAESEACVSSQNDDETHFAAPWAYSGARADAMRRVERRCGLRVQLGITATPRRRA